MATRSIPHGRALHARKATVPSAPARAPTCQPCPSLREVACACSALACRCARSLWGRGPVRAVPTRVCRVTLATLASRTMEGHCTSEKPPFFRRQPVLPRTSPAHHCARWLVRVSNLTHAVPNWRHSLRNYGRALHEQEAAVPSAHGRAPTCQPCPSLREVAWACNALARLFARSLRELGPARSHPTRASAAPRWRHSLNALCKGTTRARSRCSFGAS